MGELDKLPEPETKQKQAPQPNILGSPKPSTSVYAPSTRTADSKPERGVEPSRDSAGDRERTALALATLQHAQHELDLVAAADDREQASIFANGAIPYLKESILALGGMGKNYSFGPVVGAIEDVSLANRRAQTKLKHEVVADLVAQLEELGSVFPDKTKHRRDLGGTDKFALESIRPALAVAKRDAENLLARLQSGKVDRNALVQSSAPALGDNLTYVGEQVTLYRKHPDMQMLFVEVRGAAQALLRVRRWLAGRPDTGPAETSLEPSYVAMDQLLGQVGEPKLLTMPEPRLPEADIEAERNEHRALAEAVSDFDAALTTKMTGFALGAHRFETLARLTKTPARASLWVELVKSAIIAVVGNVASIMMVRASERIVHAIANAKLSETAKSVISGSTSDAIEPMIPLWKDAAIAMFDGNNPSENQVERERVALTETVTMGHAKLSEAYKGTVASSVKSKRIDAAGVRLLESVLVGDAFANDIVDTAFRETSHAYALLQARKHMAESKADGDEKAVTNVANYFPRPGAGQGGGALPKVGKESATGIVKLRMVITNGTTIRFEKYEVQGVNDDIAFAIAERAHYKLEGLQLPIEIEARMAEERSGKAFLKLALDETLARRDYLFLEGEGEERGADHVLAMILNQPDHSIPRNIVTIKDNED